MKNKWITLVKGIGFVPFFAFAVIGVIQSSIAHHGSFVWLTVGVIYVSSYTSFLMMNE